MLLISVLFVVLICRLAVGFAQEDNVVSIVPTGIFAGKLVYYERGHKAIRRGKGAIGKAVIAGERVRVRRGAYRQLVALKASGNRFYRPLEELLRSSFS